MDAVALPDTVEWTLCAGDYTASVVGLGATLRTLTYRSRNLVMAFEPHEERPAMRGALLAPWPNRTASGRYSFGGETHQLPVNDAESGSAVHGIAAWVQFSARDVRHDRVVLTGTIEAQAGYPWRVMLEVVYELDADGLLAEVTAMNLSPTIAPFGLGFHPYLLASQPGVDVVDEWFLEVPASEVLLTDDRMLPAELVAVADHEGGAFDFRSARRLGRTAINHAFTALDRDGVGLVRVRVAGADGNGAELEWDRRSEWVQIYTADASTDVPRHAIAVEPMTCPPDALNSTRGLISLAPGEATTVGWRVRAVAAAGRRAGSP